MFEERELSFVLGKIFGFHLALAMFFSIFYYINMKFSLIGLPFSYPAYILTILSISFAYTFARILIK